MQKTFISTHFTDVLTMIVKDVRSQLLHSDYVTERKGRASGYRDTPYNISHCVLTYRIYLQSSKEVTYRGNAKSGRLYTGVTVNLVSPEIRYPRAEFLSIPQGTPPPRPAPRPPRFP